jgi:hypothetical protein
MATKPEEFRFVLAATDGLGLAANAWARHRNPGAYTTASYDQTAELVRGYAPADGPWRVVLAGAGDQLSQQMQMTAVLRVAGGRDVHFVHMDLQPFTTITAVVDLTDGHAVASADGLSDSHVIVLRQVAFNAESAGRMIRNLRAAAPGAAIVVDYATYAPTDVVQLLLGEAKADSNVSASGLDAAKVWIPGRTWVALRGPPPAPPAPAAPAPPAPAAPAPAAIAWADVLQHAHPGGQGVVYCTINSDGAAYAGQTVDRHAEGVGAHAVVQAFNRRAQSHHRDQSAVYHIAGGTRLELKADQLEPVDSAVATAGMGSALECAVSSLRANAQSPLASDRTAWVATLPGDAARPAVWVILIDTNRPGLAPRLTATAVELHAIVRFMSAEHLRCMNVVCGASCQHNRNVNHCACLAYQHTACARNSPRPPDPPPPPQRSPT